jgi:hypothetical protein
MKTAQVSTIIDERLRLILFGIQVKLRVSFSGVLIESIFRDSTDDTISEKHYRLLHQGKVQVYGEVGEYEPETFHLTVISRTISQTELDEIATLAENECSRSTRDREA